MNEVAKLNESRASNQKMIATILESDSSHKKLNDFFAGDSAKVQRFKSSLINIAGNSILSSCSPASIIRSAFSLAEIGLDINQTLKQSYVLKYGIEAEPVISYKGWQSILEKVGKKSRAFCVFKCDTFNIDFSTFEGNLTFVPNYAQRDETNRKWFNDNLLGVVVLIKDKDASEIVNFVSAKKIDKIKGCSPSVKKGRNSPYDEWFEEMYLAKAIKYVLSKQALTEKEETIARAIDIENEVEAKIQKEASNYEIKDLEELMQDKEVMAMTLDAEEGIPQI
ncbi:recombinase RecT [Helicobacter sp. MIT 05-5294]|uniref:recombinase RecT n=1 Tax=Helicobacter sp. MIT 05-5294 TaxID=1548150 RepID=UPI00051F934C|nr:recombinase RecT [Helicobacter sp. MIT 05-5294]TLD85824.1 hypothetical protein LS69_007975 [Helicobacter sp. MIT 05-5294]